MSTKRFVQYPPGKIHPVTRTDFGKEVENDEINWWVFKQEHDIPTLRQKTEVALQAAQVLKEESQKISRFSNKSLKELNQTYETFVQKYERKISIILNYVQWLYSRNELAPTILFNYRTWGSTRMADRSTTTQLVDLGKSDNLEMLTLIVLGLIQREQPISRWIRFDLEADLFDSADIEDSLHNLRSLGKTG